MTNYNRKVIYHASLSKLKLHSIGFKHTPLTGLLGMACQVVDTDGLKLYGWMDA